MAANMTASSFVAGSSGSLCGHLRLKEVRKALRSLRLAEPGQAKMMDKVYGFVAELGYEADADGQGSGEQLTNDREATGHVPIAYE